MTPLSPLAGRIEGRIHRYPVRVYYEDTDAGAVAYHAAYLGFAERARTEFLRAIGWPHQRMHEAGCLWAVRNLSIDYVLPARLDDALLVTTSMLTAKGASVTALQVIARGADELARITLRIAVLALSGRPIRMPPGLHQDLFPFLSS